MGTVETGVDLGAEELSRVSLQMSTVACEFGSELLRNIPARTPDSEIQHGKACPKTYFQDYVRSQQSR